MIEAFSIAKRKGCGWKLIIIGEGEDKSNLLQLVEKKGISSEVIFLGYQSNPYPFIKMAGAFVSSSREEGFPVSLIEALSLECPIIALGCPTGPKDLLENGFLGMLLPFTLMDPNGLANAMFELSINKELTSAYRNKMVNKAEKYSSVNIGNEFTELILSYQRA